MLLFHCFCILSHAFWLMNSIRCCQQSEGAVTMFFPRTSGKGQLKTGRPKLLSKCGLMPPMGWCYHGSGKALGRWVEAGLATGPRASVLTVAQRKNERNAQWETETLARLILRGLLTQVHTTCSWELYKTQALPWTSWLIRSGWI